MLEPRQRSAESLAREAMRLYWQVVSHGVEAAIPERRIVEPEYDLVSIAQEIFERLSKKRQAEVMRRIRELEELPSGSAPRGFEGGIACPPRVPEDVWLTYLTVATQEEHLRLRVASPVPWQMIRAVQSEGLLVHPDWDELSPWSAREFGERLMGWRATPLTDWPERHADGMLRSAYRRIGRYLWG